MTRTTLMLPADLKARSERRAREIGISMGELVRRSLVRLLDETAAPASDDALYADAVVSAAETPRDLAERHDDYLYGDPA
jgi:hypothetical protein